MAVDDLAELIPLLFNLDRRKATYFNAAFINKSLSANKAVRNALNLPQNDVGIYQKNGLHRQTYYYLSSGSTTKLISDFIAIYVLYYVYIFVHASKI